MSEAFYSLLIMALWIGWAVYWRISSSGTKSNVRRESPASRAAHIVPLMLSYLLIAAPRIPGPEWFFRPLVANFFMAYWSGIALLVAGLGFAIWARVHLGRNWSGTVTLKQGHELIQTGPYALVRHPIYTGLLLAILGSALCRNQWRGVLSVALAAAAFTYKLRLEERWMVETFGDQYRSYRARVRALIPFVI